MKAYILAADEEARLFANGPRCYGLSPLIETQVTSLLAQGISLDDIFLVKNRLATEDKKIRQQIRKLAVNLLYVDSHGLRSLDTFLQVINCIDVSSNVIFLNGDTYVSPEDLEALTYSPRDASILVEKRYNQNAVGIFIDEKSRDCFVNTEPNYAHSIPWDCFSGAMYLPSGKISHLSKSASRDISYIEYLLRETDIDFKVCNRVNREHQKFLSQSSANLIGGSFANLSDTSLVIKTADKTGAVKLKNEIDWLNSLNHEQKKHFSEVVDQRITQEHVQYSMPYYGYPSMRYCMLNSIINPNILAAKLDEVLQFLEVNFYEIKMPFIPDWLKTRHFDRFDERLLVTRKNSVMAELISHPEVMINGKRYAALSTLFNKIRENYILLERVQPSKIVMIHGDLHLQNILISPKSKDFMLVDPRGELFGADLYYDLGKIWHSVNGLYDLIHTDIATLKRKQSQKNEFHLSHGPSFLLHRYKLLKNAFYNVLEDRFAITDKDWYLKMLFNEAMHFSTLVNFHLKNDGNEHRAQIIYLTAIKLCHELIEYYEESEC